MQTSLITQPSWQDLFRTNSGSESLVSWRVLRKKGEPLLVLPESGRAAAMSLTLYAAQSAKARFLKSFLRWTLRLHLPLPLERTTISMDINAPFPRFLREQAGTSGFPPLGIFAGNPRTVGRRFILLLFGNNCEPACVVKAGKGEAAVQLIDRAKDFLASVPQSLAGLPKVFGTFHGENLSAIAMEFAEGEFPSVDDAKLVDSLLNAWVIEEQSVSLCETASWREMASVCSSLSLWPQLETLGRRSVRRVVYHGDFAPWNMKLDRRTGRCVVFDWERGELVGVPGWDWFHFLIQSSILVEKLTTGGLRHKLEELLRSERFSAYAARCGIIGCERELLLAYLLYCVMVLKPQEGTAENLALFKLLSDSWTNDSKS